MVVWKIIYIMASLAKSGALVAIICIFFSLFLFGALHFNKQDDTNKEDNGTPSDYFNAKAEGYYLPNGQPIIRLPKYGQLKGSLGFTAWNNRTIFQFRNVPYAESPSGSRRFKAPVPIKPWDGIRNAENYGRKCPTLFDLKGLQRNAARNEDLEDCLIMAIFSTKLNASYPVMVYIHGGGFYSNNADHYPPQYMMERDIILVVIQFRLDALGFLSTSSDEIPGNAGLMDTVQALHFVKENIQYFGGDPNKITIFGQSGGGIMVSALIISPNVPRNLFQQAIVQSGTILVNRGYVTDPIADARILAKAAGLDPNQSIDALNQAFIKMDIFDLFEAIEKVEKSTNMSPKEMTVGRSLSVGGPDKLLPDTPRNIVTSKNYNHSIPLIIGATKHDGTYHTGVLYDYLAVSNKLKDKDFMVNDLVNLLAEYFDLRDDADTFSAVSSLVFWPAKELESGNFTICVPGVIDMLGTAIFKAPSLQFAKINTRTKHHKTYLYTFDYKGEHTRFGYGDDASHYPFVGGVHHSDDLIYLFPDPPDVAKLNATDTKIAQMMVDLWTSFAIDGVPKLSRIQNELNEKNEFVWEPFQGLHGPYLRINQHLSIKDDYRVEFTAALQNTSEIKKK